MSSKSQGKEEALQKKKKKKKKRNKWRKTVKREIARGKPGTTSIYIKRETKGRKKHLKKGAEIY